MLENFLDIIKSVRTGYALMALAFLLVGVVAFQGRLTPDQVFYLSLFMVAVALLAVFLLRGEHEKVSQISSTEILDAKLTSFVDSAERPVYVTDEKLVVQYCNKQFLSFIGARQEQIVGSHVNTVIEFFEKLVPVERRKLFRKRQTELLKDAATAPYACISEIVDFKQRPSAKDTRMYLVWIQADFIYAGDQNRAIGSVVIYHPVEVTLDRAGKFAFPDLQI